MKAIIPVAGYATRLYPLTKNSPKALLKIAGKTMLDHCLDKISELGVIRDVYVVTNDKFFEKFVLWNSKYSGNLRVYVINDGTSNNDDRLGALGDLQFVIDAEQIYDDILVIAGDNFFQDNLLGLYNVFTKTQRSSIAIYDIKDIGKAGSFGVVGIDTQGRVVSFIEKPKNPKSSLISTMIYCVHKRDLHNIQTCIDQGQADNGGNLIANIVKSSEVYTYCLRGYWYDIGNRDQLEFLKRRLG